jgi:hypothetical protein
MGDQKRPVYCAQAFCLYNAPITTTYEPCSAVKERITLTMLREEALTCAQGSLDKSRLERLERIGRRIPAFNQNRPIVL